MIEAYIVSATSFMAMLTYGYRSGTMRRHEGWPATAARYSFIALLGALGVAYLDVAVDQTELVWRQWLVFAVIVGVLFSNAALLWTLGHRPWDTLVRKKGSHEVTTRTHR